MQDYDPLKDLKKTEFPKELKNMGIDKESISKEGAETKEKTGVTEKTEPEDNKLLAMIKKNEERIALLDKRLINLVATTNKVLNEFNEKIEGIMNRPSAPKIVTEPANEKDSEKSEPKKNDDLEPGDIKIEEYFNFSNAKFK